MNAPRTFTDTEAKRETVPLLVGITGPSGSGKSYSALRLATGMARVLKSEIGVIDTESKRMLHYADKFKFRHLDLQAPFGPLDYLAAIRHFYDKGIRLLVIDSMTHEHSSEGGVMSQSEKYLDLKAGDDEQKRSKLFMGSLKEPKAQRRKLNDAILHMGINAIFCYRAHEKVKPVQGEGVKNMGWQPETTSPLVYEMTARFLLLPACDGKPDSEPQTIGEKMLTKNPEQFRGWFNAGTQLNEDLGEKMANWAKGIGDPVALTNLPVAWDSWTLEERGDNRANAGTTDLEAWWKSLSIPEKKTLQPKLAGWKQTAETVKT